MKTVWTLATQIKAGDWVLYLGEPRLVLRTRTFQDKNFGWYIIELLFAGASDYAHVFLDRMLPLIPPETTELA